VVFEACLNAAFLALGIFYKYIASAFSSTRDRGIAIADMPPFDVVRSDVDGEEVDNIGYASGGGPEGKADIKNGRTRFRKRSRFCII